MAEPRALAAQRGIHHRATGDEAAKRALRAMMREIEPYLHANTKLTIGHFALTALITRAQARVQDSTVSIFLSHFRNRLASALIFIQPGQ